MAARRDLVKRARARAGPRRARRSSAPRLAVEHAEGARQFAVGVREQGEREGVLFGERAMRFDRIDADADDRALERRELLVEVAKFLALDRASGRVVGRVEVDHEPVAAKFRQPALIAMLVAERNLRRRAQVVARAQSLSWTA